MRKAVCLAIAALFFWVASAAQGREAGWVPLSKEPWQPPASSGAGKYTGKKAAKRAASRSPGTTVYDRQPLVTERELGRFLPLLPQFRAWARKNNEDAHPVINPKGQPDFLYSANAGKWVKSHGFEPARFFCIMGRMAAGLAIIEEGNDLPATRPKDMPPVDPAEISLARKHLGELLSVAIEPLK